MTKSDPPACPPWAHTALTAEEPEALAAVVDDFSASIDEGAEALSDATTELENALEGIQEIPARLEAHADAPELLAELDPWLTYVERAAETGLGIAEVTRRVLLEGDTTDPGETWNTWLETREGVEWVEGEATEGVAPEVFRRLYHDPGTDLQLGEYFQFEEEGALDVTASTTLEAQEGESVEGAVDRNATSAFRSATEPVAGDSLTVDLGEAQDLYQVIVVQDPEAHVTDGAVALSADGETWWELAPLDAASVNIASLSPQWARYLRLQVDTDQQSLWSVNEITFVTGTPDPLPLTVSVADDLRVLTCADYAVDRLIGSNLRTDRAPEAGETLWFELPEPTEVGDVVVLSSQDGDPTNATLLGQTAEGALVELGTFSGGYYASFSAEGRSLASLGIRYDTDAEAAACINQVAAFSP